MDVSTCWNSSFLAWKRLLLIKDAINIVLATLTVSSATEAKKDAKRLKEIQLTNNEWDLMRDIVNILGPFFEVTEALSGSEYVTFSCMIPSILGLMNKLGCSIEGSDKLNNTINFEMNNLVFNDNVGFVDAQEEEEGGPKGRKIKINTPIDVTNMQHKIKNTLYNALLHYWDLSDEELFLAYLLDLSLKSLHQSSLTQTNQPLDFYDEQCSTENNQKECQIYQKTFFKSIFMHNTFDESNDENDEI
ncbi:8804_t:CDS:2, partial [Cetraspora pellucida]